MGRIDYHVIQDHDPTYKYITSLYSNAIEHAQWLLEEFPGCEVSIVEDHWVRVIQEAWNSEERPI